MSEKKLAFSPRRILVPIDGSGNSMRALDTAIELAKNIGSELFIFTVIPLHSLAVGAAVGFSSVSVPLQDYYDATEKQAKDFLEQAKSLATTSGVVKVSGEIDLEYESIPEQIIDRAGKEKSDLIVIGTRGLGGFKRLLLGSVSSGVVTHANCNVLVVR